MSAKSLFRVSLLGLAAAMLLFNAGCALSRIKTATELAKIAEPYQANPDSPAHRLLIVGDSTAVGTGATAPAKSVAGLIGRDHPDWQIVNRGRNGAKLAEVLQQLQGSGQRFDTVLVLAGGNDVMRLTGWAEVRRSVNQVVEAAAALAPRVVFMPSGNVGNAPFFHAPISWYMSARSRELHQTVRETAARSGAAYVNLYKEPEDDPFVQQPERMNAADMLHPSDDGYALWRGTLKAQAGF